ncbi:MAG: primosomal protein N' [Gammaproteobacteria bacterium]|nr:MAG: primosomal protein N' [Gammaproteobacteria bacterium]RLA61871.1 MAG: primosomal protein N' [Gammaproteobacteria bacterium]
MSILRLAIPSPLRRSFDYLPPAGTCEAQLHSLQPGLRVRVPFGRREVIGYLLAVKLDSDVPEKSLKTALAILDPAPLVNPRLLQLCYWAAHYYHHPLSEVLAAIFPKRLREGKAHQSLGSAGWQLTTHGLGLAPDALARSPRQAQTLASLRTQGTVATVQLKDQGISSTVLRSLRDKGLIEETMVPLQAEPASSAQGLSLNPEQAVAINELLKTPAGFVCHLLEGVTGSGKTEIYLQLIADCLQRGKQALVLIPEIGLTPQTLNRFEQRFSANIVVFHSGLGEAQRYRAWEAARDGSAHIVIGTRSAIFTPLRKPGLIIVDEEHDSSYKQQDGFRYNARDVAVKRAQLEACPVLLGSATPSLESLHNTLAGRYRHHRLTQRAGSGRMPTIEALDVRRQALQAGLSTGLLDAIKDRLESGQQSLLFLNRRGYAPTLQCHDCGWIAECMACDARLTVHRRLRRLRCHHCGASRALPRQCPHCHSNNLLAAGLGTEQTEEFLREQFSRWPVFRVDSDSMQGKTAMQDLITEINKGEPCILLGTQMLTKGHHFPGVNLVAVIDTDAMLFSADFRGEERMAQLLTQVAGRAGRAGLPGSVILQTHYPDHPALQAMLHSSYAQQAREQLSRRQATGMPPVGQLVILRTDCGDAQCGELFLQNLRDQAAADLPVGTAMIGPLPSPMQRRAGKFRSQLLLTAPNRKTAQAAADILVAIAETLPARRGLKWSIDIDPQDVF